MQIELTAREWRDVRNCLFIEAKLNFEASISESIDQIGRRLAALRAERLKRLYKKLGVR